MTARHRFPLDPRAKTTAQTPWRTLWVAVLVCSTCPASASDLSTPATKPIRSALVTGYRECTVPDTCVGPVPVKPEDEAAPTGATCPDALGDCNHPWCRPACSTPVRNDSQCGFDPLVGWGAISGAVRRDGTGFRLEATAHGITGCEGEQLCFGFSVRPTFHSNDYTGTCNSLCTAHLPEPLVLTTPVSGNSMPTVGPPACCTVSNGVCDISTDMSGYFDGSLYPHVTAGGFNTEEIMTAGMYRRTADGFEEPAFVPGLTLGAPETAGSLNHPAVAKSATASFVRGYRPIESGNAFTTSVPNDPHCRFRDGSSGGTTTIRASRSDVRVSVNVHGIDCDADNVQLCLTSSARLTTSACTSPSGCTVIEVKDEPVGRANPAGCCTVTKARGRCRISASLSQVAALDPNKFSLGLSLGNGLQRVTSIGGDDALHDTWPAFVVGLFLP